MRIGGAKEKIRVYPLSSDVQTAATLSSFDARKARCYHAKDRQHLLGVIEHGFGSFDAFNAIARKMLTDRDVLSSARPRDAPPAAPRSSTMSRLLLDLGSRTTDGSRKSEMSGVGVDPRGSRKSRMTEDSRRSRMTDRSRKSTAVDLQPTI